jgi:hypothetical protein
VRRPKQGETGGVGRVAAMEALKSLDDVAYALRLGLSQFPRGRDFHDVLGEPGTNEEAKGTRLT